MPNGPKLNPKTLYPLVAALFVVTVLTISFFNLKSYFYTPKVLGTETEIQINPAQTFWEQFLAKNPNYFPGWIELSKIDEKNGNHPKSDEDLNHARSINPNAPEVN
jgi:hypothetical protein